MLKATKKEEPKSQESGNKELAHQLVEIAFFVFGFAAVICELVRRDGNEKAEIG